MAAWDTYKHRFQGYARRTGTRVAIIRDLTPGKYKYKATYAKVKISEDAKNIRNSSG